MLSDIRSWDSFSAALLIMICTSLCGLLFQSSKIVSIHDLCIVDQRPKVSIWSPTQCSFCFSFPKNIILCLIFALCGQPYLENFTYLHWPRSSVNWHCFLCPIWGSILIRTPMMTLTADNCSRCTGYTVLYNKLDLNAEFMFMIGLDSWSRWF